MIYSNVRCSFGRDTLGMGQEKQNICLLGQINWSNLADQLSNSCHSHYMLSLSIWNSTSTSTDMDSSKRNVCDLVTVKSYYLGKHNRSKPLNLLVPRLEINQNVQISDYTKRHTPKLLSWNITGWNKKKNESSDTITKSRSVINGLIGIYSKNIQG